MFEKTKIHEKEAGFGPLKNREDVQASYGAKKETVKTFNKNKLSSFRSVLTLVGPFKNESMRWKVEVAFPPSSTYFGSSPLVCRTMTDETTQWQLSGFLLCKNKLNADDDD